MGLKDRLRRLERAAKGDGIVLRLRDGTVRVFAAMDIHSEMFLAQMDLFRGTSRESEVLDAVRNATPESRRAFEERFGAITMSATTVAAEYQGGWVRVRTLLEDGTVETAFHEGGSEEAKRARREAREGASLGRRWAALNAGPEGLVGPNATHQQCLDGVGRSVDAVGEGDRATTPAAFEGVPVLLRPVFL